MFCLEVREQAERAEALVLRVTGGAEIRDILVPRVGAVQKIMIGDVERVDLGRENIGQSVARHLRGRCGLKKRRIRFQFEFMVVMLDGEGHLRHGFERYKMTGVVNGGEVCVVDLRGRGVCVTHSGDSRILFLVCQGVSDLSFEHQTRIGLGGFIQFTTEDTEDAELF